LSQLFKVGHIYTSNKFLPMDVMHGEDVVLMEDKLVALLQPVQSSLDQRVIHDATEEFP
jgi:hypothetical protein